MSNRQLHHWKKNQSHSISAIIDPDTSANIFTALTDTMDTHLLPGDTRASRSFFIKLKGLPA